MADEKNVLGQALRSCCRDPMTGFYRDGFCWTASEDHGKHVVCAEMTQAFLDYTKSRGNDLTRASPQFGFPGLKPGDRWCLCVHRWREALRAGFAPPVILESCHIKALDVVSLEELQAHSLESPAKEKP